MTKKELKRENKALREEIHKLVFGTWLDKAEIEYKYRWQKDLQDYLFPPDTFIGFIPTIKRESEGV